jgi:hypothetical protein
MMNRITFCVFLDWPLSTEFKNNFCWLFEIPALSDVIQIQAQVLNEQQSIDLFDFYSPSMELIQYFLLTEGFITVERSKYLASVFRRMHFVCVEQIQLLYQYEGKTLRTEMCNTHVDERAGRFYILKKLEQSDVCYIESMAKYLVQDQMALAVLIPFMMNLSQIYQNEGKQSLIERRDSVITQEYDDRWIFPNVYSTPSPPPSPIEEIPLNEEPIIISAEMIEQVMNEPVPERKPPSRLTMEKDDEKNPTCFPAKANTTESTEPSNMKSHPAEKRVSTDAPTVSNSTSQVSRESDSNRARQSKFILRKKAHYFSSK